MEFPGRSHSWRLPLLVALCLTLAACTSPVRAVRVDRKAAHADLTRSAITTGKPSWPTRDVLQERGLVDAFDKRPEVAIDELHRIMVATQGDPDVLFALTELSYLHGEKAGERDHLLASSVYAYAFLFPDEGDARPGAFDPRLRIAADLYNWSLTAALASEDGSEFVPRGGRFALPFGAIDVDFDPAELRAGNRELYRLIPAAELKVKGLALRYRWPGIGAPLAASTRPAENASSKGDLVAPMLQVPLTALLRIEQARRALVNEQPLAASLELHLAWDNDSVEISGESVPLESEPTAALALTFTDIPVGEFKLLSFLGRATGIMAERPPLVSASPYKPGLIPVVFVHGTVSSPLTWAEMLNRLNGDPEIRKQFQFWFFQYDSDNPIALSSLQLRESLTAAVARLDPDGQDPALRQMVLIGHSQGGLLVKMQSIQSGDQIWNSVSRKPLDELKLSDTTRDLLRRGLFVEPVPEVTRVVFISTPHRGSFVAGYHFVASLARRLTRMPFELNSVSADLARNRGALKVSRVPTAVDNMSPRHPFILGLQQVPIAPQIEAHSIISVKEKYDPYQDGNDGVVEYKSAHIDEAVSEAVVRSPHSCTAKPHTMEEVRRILRLHAGLATGATSEEP